ncbi:MAG TPA: DUF3341 domain-containing protein [Candidatus Nanopelagicales bacterium]|nr:DUF3341 domain-containing protein [Candidatus Nanopelagicales bacterium]
MKKGLLAEFETPEALLGAIEELRRRGYRDLDAFTPYPVHGLEQKLGLQRSRLTWLVFPFALAGATLGYCIQWYLNARNYPLNVGGRPPHSAPAFIPVTFEMTVLTSALVGLLVFFILCRLPELYNPIFDVEGFERASQDRFWLGIDARDPALVRGRAERELHEIGALRVAWTAGGEPPGMPEGRPGEEGAS